MSEEGAGEIKTVVGKESVCPKCGRETKDCPSWRITKSHFYPKRARALKKVIVPDA